ncbi:hypothetical protein [Clostridioides difficile]|uniref:hypothetical protein n=1 Tax=Clostridioides difficile TaxID=1496 RepID=UPI003080FC99
MLKIPKQKEDTFKKHKEIIDIIYYLCNKIVLKQQLTQLCLKLTKYREIDVDIAIAELAQQNILSKKQFLNTNRKLIYLTKYPVSQLENIKSRNVQSIKLTPEKIIKGVFKTEYILKKIEGLQDINLNYVLEMFNTEDNTILKREEEEIYKTLFNKYKNILEKDFVEDLRISIAKKIIMENRFKKDKKTTVTDVELLKRRQKSIKMMGNCYYFNFNNMLCRNFFLEKINIKDTNIKLKIGFLDIYNTKNVTKIINNICYIYFMFLKYFSRSYSLSIKLCIYTYSKKNATEIKNNILKKSVDFKSKQIKNINIKENILLKNSINPEKIKIGITSLDIVKYI